MQAIDGQLVREILWFFFFLEKCFLMGMEKSRNSGAIHLADSVHEVCHWPHLFNLSNKASSSVSVFVAGLRVSLESYRIR